MNLNKQFFDSLKENLAKGKTDIVVTNLVKFIRKYKIEDLSISTSVLLISSQNADLKRVEALQLAPSQEIETRKARLTRSIIYLIDELAEETGIPERDHKTSPEERMLLEKRINQITNKLQFLNEKLDTVSNHNQEYEIRSDIEKLTKELSDLKVRIYGLNS